MEIIKNNLQKVFDECYIIYQLNGYSDVIDHVNEQQKINNPLYTNVVEEYCDQCENDMPSLYHVCLICGQDTIPIDDHKIERKLFEIQKEDATEQYFTIVHQGYQEDLLREEIQIHAGENFNIFLIKTEEGFIVDVYNQDDFVDTLAIWDDNDDTYFDALIDSYDKLNDQTKENDDKDHPM